MDTKCPQTGDECLSTFFENYPEMLACEGEVRAARDLIAASFRSGGKLLVCGNGGSAADSEHTVGELMKSFRFKRRGLLRGLPRGQRHRGPLMARGVASRHLACIADSAVHGVR